MLTHLTDKLAQFREELYALFPKRSDAIFNLLDALTGHARHCDSIVQLSNAPCFERQYSSITDAIADGLPEAKWNEIKKLLYQQYDDSLDKKKPHRFVVDCTPNPRPFAKTLNDRHITHAPNPAPGNKPICVGHQYSVLALLPHEDSSAQKHWLVPLAAQRVDSSQKGNEVGMQQIVDSIQELGLSDDMSISIGDTLYGTDSCRSTASEQPNLVHLHRLANNRNVFCQPETPQDNLTRKGRKKEFGDKMPLGDPGSHPPGDEEATTTWVTRQGKTHTVTITCWHDKLLRGSREFRASQHPFNLIKITVTNEQGKAVYQRPLWLAVWGERRHEVSLADAYQHYSSRYDIEHFFRFGKRNLLMDTYQTPDVAHESLWWQFCLLAYTQLFLTKEIVSALPQPWERYLPEYQQSDQPGPRVQTPSQTQRGFPDVLNTIGTPAKACIPRGKPCGRSTGETQPKRSVSSIVFKTKKAPEKNIDPILSGSEPSLEASNPQKIDDIAQWIQWSLKKFDLTSEELAQKILDSS